MKNEIRNFHPDVPLTEGMWAGVPYDVYKVFPARNSTQLKKMFKKPADALKGSQENRSTVIGKATHSCIFEPDTMDELYDVCPYTSWKDVQQYRERAKKINPMVTVLSQEDASLINKIRANVAKHNDLQEYLSGTFHELTVIFRYREHLCKARLDAVRKINESIMIIDLKTCLDATWEEFAKTINRYKYHFQAAFYRLAMRQALLLNSDTPVHFLFVAAEKEGNCDIALYELISDSMDQGQLMVDQALDIWEKCEEENNFPTFIQKPLLITHEYWKGRI